ncbi:MAG TPA: tetratricopeptide repeat protein [Trueperaceae bacterium]
MSTAKVRGSKACVQGILIVAAVFAPMALAQEATSKLDELKHTAQEQPANPAAWVDLGQAYLEAERYADAKDAFMEAIAIDYLSGDAHFGLGLSEYGQGDYQAALFEFNEVARLFPDRFDGQFNRAVTLSKLRRHEDAAAAFQKALAEADPEATPQDKVGAYQGLAGELEQLGRYDEAAKAYASALALQPNDDSLTYRRANALYRAGKGLEALPLLTELEAGSGDYRVSTLIADIYVEAGQIDYALRSLERAYKKAESAGEVHAQANILVKLGLLQRGLGRQEKAIQAFETATRTDPASWQALYNLGVSYLESGQADAAVRVLEDAVLQSPGSGEVRLALAAVYDQLGRHADALDQAEAALSSLDEAGLTAKAQMIVGRSLYGMADYRGALNAFERVVDAEPSNAQAQLWAGLAVYQQGEYKKAAQYFERAVQLEPDSVEARVNLGAAYLAAQRYNDAQIVYQLVVQQNPDNAEAYYNLGWALYSQGSRDAAKQAWQTAGSLNYGPAQQALQQYF